MARVRNFNRCQLLAEEIGKTPADRLLDRSLLSGDLGYAFRDRVRSWVEHASHEAQAGNHLSAFVHLWIPFNAWAAAVVKERGAAENDWQLVQALGFDDPMSSKFRDLISREAPFQDNVKQFRDLWPVFKVRALQEKGLGSSREHKSRDEYRKDCLSKLTDKDYQPRCFKNHAGSELPIDWPHTLAAIYQVRCNLFHGGKTFEDEDSTFCRYGYEILKPMWLPELPQ